MKVIMLRAVRYKEWQRYVEELGKKDRRETKGKIN
jgi:hypothetical protein